MLRYLMICAIFSRCLSMPQNEATNPKCDSYAQYGYRCVPYYQCDENGYIKTDGNGLLTIRTNLHIDDKAQEAVCDKLVDVCCLHKNKAIPPSPTCGKRSKKFELSEKQTDKRVSDSRFGEWPHVCAIIQEEDVENTKVNIYKCAGSLISPGVILTAAHCVNDVTHKNLIVRCGEWDTFHRNEALEHQERTVHSIIKHPQFNNNNLHWDFALLITEEDFTLAEHISPVCLPSPKQDYQRKECVANGWGKDKFGSEGHYQNILKQLNLPLVDHEKCEEALRGTRLGSFFKLDETFICAGGERGVDTCKGDGGGPLTCRQEDSGPWVQEGIVSWGIGCGNEGIPAVYARVSKAVCWIDMVLSCFFDAVPGQSFLGFQEDCSDDYYSDDSCDTIM